MTFRISFDVREILINVDSKNYVVAYHKEKVFFRSFESSVQQRKIIDEKVYVNEHPFKNEFFGEKMKKIKKYYLVTRKNFIFIS